MMINIAICDDNSDDRQRLFELVNKYFNTYSRPCVIELHGSGKSLLDSAKVKNLELVFLDVILGDINGINVAAKLKSLLPKAVVIFISNSREFAVDGYAVDALSYLVKPVSEDALFVCIDKFMSTYTEEEERFIGIRSEGVRIAVPVDKITYLESNDKKVYLHLKDNPEPLETYGKLDDLNLALIKYRNFLRCHKSYLINMDYVDRISEYRFILKDETLIPIPKDVASAKKKIYYDYLMEKN